MIKIWKFKDFDRHEPIHLNYISRLQSIAPRHQEKVSEENLQIKKVANTRKTLLRTMSQKIC